MANRCSVEGCGHPGRTPTADLCNAHYARQRKYGDPLAGGAFRDELSDVCIVEGCERLYLARGYCVAHYDRWKKYGTPGVATIAPRNPGAVCSIDDCGKPHCGNGYCVMHLYRWKKYGDSSQVGGNQDQEGSKNPSWHGDQVLYNGAHKRVRRRKGSVSGKSCLHCGELADQWAYDHEDANERVDERGLRYSTDPAHYIPLCLRCHRLFDRMECAI